MSGGVLQAPRKLARDDGRSASSSGASELDDRFRRSVWENNHAGLRPSDQARRVSRESP